MSDSYSLPSALSPSRLGDFRSCAKKYFFSSIKKVPQKTSFAAVKGTFLHKILEHFYKLSSDDRTLVAAQSFIDTAFDEVYTEKIRRDLECTDTMERSLKKDARDILSTYFTMEDAADIRVEGTERFLHVKIDDTPLRGIIDRLDRRRDGLLDIVDYKTGRVPKSPHLDGTFTNAEIYALMIQESLGERPSTIRLLYVTHGEELPHEVSDDMIQRQRENVTSAWGDIKEMFANNEWPASPSETACRWCDYKDICEFTAVRSPTRP